MSEQQIPRGPSNMTCPHRRSWLGFHQKMSKVCHKCPLWTFVGGTHPQTGEEVRRWDCAHAHGPILMLEAAKMGHKTAAAVEKRGNTTARLLGELILRTERMHREAQQSTADEPKAALSNGAGEPMQMDILDEIRKKEAVDL